MRTIHKPTSILTALIIAAMFVTTFSSCKKDISYSTPNFDLSQMQKSKAKVLKQIENTGGIPQIFNTNIATKMQWVDKNSNPIDASNQLVSVCNWDYPNYCNIVQYARVYNCGTPQGY